MSDIPWVLREPGEIIVRCAEQGQDIRVEQFCADVLKVAKELPDARYAVNLCQDRYRFWTAFFAVACRGQINLLPAKRDLEHAVLLGDQYSSCSVLVDQQAEPGAHLVEVTPGTNGSAVSGSLPSDQVIAIAFTSGSTGTPQPHEKTWGMLSAFRQMHAEHVQTSSALPLGLVATVPCWHMYGLEWVMMLATVAPVTVYCGADFFPQDVTRALDSFGRPGMLVSTPVHLRALSKGPGCEQPVAMTVSATAPLDQALIERIEQHLQTQILEIYGCSEVGTLAWRNPGTSLSWAFFGEFAVTYKNGQITVGHPTLTNEVTLADLFEALADGKYALQGRAGDIVKVGGKRESLAKLNSILLSIEGVEDGHFFSPAAFDLPDTGRLSLVAVAPSLDAQHIRAALAVHIDPVFLPRPVRLVDALPRDSTSKLKRESFVELLTQLGVDDE